MVPAAVAQAPQNGSTQQQNDQYAYVQSVYRVESVPKAKKTTSQEGEEWRKYLYSLTTQEEFKILDCIATHESGWKNVPNYLYDGEDGKFTAFGPFQVLKSTAKTYSSGDRRDPYENIRIAVALYRARGHTPWLVWPSCVR